MSEKLITSHNLGFLHSRPVSLAVSNNNPKTLQAFSALVGLVAVAHPNKDLVCTGHLDVVQHPSDFVTVMVFGNFVTVMVFGKDATTTDPDIDKPEFVVVFVESGRMLEMLLLREPDNRPQLLNTGEDAPFDPIDRSLMLFRTISDNGTTNYIIAPTTPMSLTEVVVTALVKAEFGEKED